MSESRSDRAAGECGARLARAVAGLGDDDWLAELIALGAPVPTEDPGPPTYEDLAGGGVATVTGLVECGRWDDADRQAQRLTRLFHLNRRHIHPVAAESFDGLHAAVRARDREEMTDFVELLGELFGDADG